jgi:hypothetical protein
VTIPPGIQVSPRLDPDSPTSHGCFGLPEIYTEVKMAQEMALRESRDRARQGLEGVRRHLWTGVFRLTRPTALEGAIYAAGHHAASAKPRRWWSTRSGRRRAGRASQHPPVAAFPVR